MAEKSRLDPLICNNRSDVASATTIPIKAPQADAPASEAPLVDPPSFIEVPDTKRSGLSRLFSRGFWAIADQGLFSVSNAALNIILARMLTEAEFGGFVAGFALFLILGTVHNAFLIEPMLIFGAQTYRSWLRQYFGFLIYGHWWVATGCAAVIAGAGVVARMTGHVEIGNAMFSVAAASPFILFLWMMRRACYVRLDPKLAAVAGVLYLFIVGAGIYILHRFEAFTLFKAMVVMSVAGLASGIWLALKERVAKPEPSDPNIRSATMDHWRYGRWAAGTGIVGCLPGQLYFLMLPHLEYSGALRAMTLLLMPAFQAISAICMILLPQLSRARGTPQFARLMKLGMVVLVAGPLLFWIFLGLTHYPLMKLVYGGKFLDCSHLLWIIGFQPILAAILGVYMAALGAQERPDMVFYTNLVGAVVTCTLGIWMTVAYGLAGVAWSSNIASGMSVIVGWYCMRRLSRANPMVSTAVPEAE